MADYSELKRRAQEIRDEVKAGANTANRVGLALEDTVKALEATNEEVSKKQNKLDNYKEDPSNGSVEIFAQDKVSVRNDSQGGVSCVEVYNEEDTEGIIPVARISADKENGDYASVTVRGNEVHIEGDGVKVNGEDLESFRTTVVNDLTTGGADKALSAEMGKVLGVSVDDLEERIYDVVGAIVSRESDGVELLGNGNIKLTLKGTTKEFMPATPSGDPLHYAYETAGAEYNDTTDFIVKDAPWRHMVDTIEDKAKWGFDVVDASQVKQMTIRGTTYNYVQTTRQSPQGTTEPRYYLVSQASDGTWVEDETKVLHLPGHWYLNGIGDITGKEISLCYTQTMPWYTSSILTKAFRPLTESDNKTLKYRTTFRNVRPFATVPTNIKCESMCYDNKYIETFILTFMPVKPDITIIGLKNAFSEADNMKYLIGTVKADTSISVPKNMRVLSIIIPLNADFYTSNRISKPSILYSINKAIPTTPITITLHADRYAQLSEDADIVAALEAKNTALEGTGGSISLVSV